MNTNADVIRIETATASLTSTVRNQQIGFANDSTHQMMYKDSGGTDYYFAPEEQNATYADLTIAEKLIHDGDTNNYISFGTDNQYFYTDGSLRMRIDDSGVRIPDDEEIYFGSDKDHFIEYDSSNAKLVISQVNSFSWIEIGDDSSGPIKIDSNEITLENSGSVVTLNFGSSASDYIGFFGATAVVQESKINDPSGGGTQDAEARTAINAIIDALEAYGLLASS